MFSESNKKVFDLLFDSSTTDRTIVTSSADFHPNTGLSSKIISPKFLNASHQTQPRSGPANITNKIANFDNVNIGKYFEKISWKSLTSGFNQSGLRRKLLGQSI